MARPAVLDQRSVLNIRYRRSLERIYFKDLAKFLDCGGGRLRRWAKRNKLWHPGDVRREPDWVTPLGAMRIIAHIRAWQQQVYEGGYRYHERQDYHRAWKKKALAKRRAGTDAEPQRRGRVEAVGEAVAETPAVSDNGCPTARR